MKKFKGVKGPWFGVQYANMYWIQDGEMYEDNNILDTDSYSESKVKANIKLIENCPDLLNTCLELLELFDHPSACAIEEKMKELNEITDKIISC